MSEAVTMLVCGVMRERRKRPSVMSAVPAIGNFLYRPRLLMRCPEVMDRCRVEEPIRVQVGQGHFASCWKVTE